MGIKALITSAFALLLAGCITTSAQPMPGAAVTYWQDYVVGRSSAPAHYVEAARAAMAAGRIKLVILDQDGIDTVCGRGTWGCSPAGALQYLDSCTVVMSEEIDNVQLLAYLVTDHEAAHCVGWSSEAYHPIGVNPTDQQLAFFSVANAEAIVGRSLAANTAVSPAGRAAINAAIAEVMAFCERGRALVRINNPDLPLPPCP